MNSPRPRNALRRAALALACAVALPWSATAHAQAYPAKPIRMIVPLAAGSAVDVAARLLAAKMSQNMGQTVVVENVVGAAGIIGASQLAKAAPDGYTIGGFNDSILTMVPNLNPNTPFNPMTDFVHVSRVAIIEFSIAVAANSPWKSAADLVAAAGWLREHLRAPQLLVGHSLGGAAVLVAAADIPEVRAVATGGAPSDTAHVIGLIGDAVATLEDGILVLRVDLRPDAAKK